MDVQIWNRPFIWLWYELFLLPGRPFISFFPHQSFHSRTTTAIFVKCSIADCYMVYHPKATPPKLYPTIYILRTSRRETVSGLLKCQFSWRHNLHRSNSKLEGDSPHVLLIDRQVFSYKNQYCAVPPSLNVHHGGHHHAVDATKPPMHRQCWQLKRRQQRGEFVIHDAAAAA